MHRLLFVDDDEEILSINQKYFESKDYKTDIALDASDALLCLNSHTYSCLILDIQMENIDGLHLCKIIREQYETPIIFLTNLTEEDILVQSFTYGGDDYLTKPFRLRELEMRIAARIRNYANTKTSNLYNNTTKLSINFGAKQAYLCGQSLQLTLNEFEILYFLMEHKGTPYRQEEIYHAIWKENYYNTHSIQTLVMRIRKKIQRISPEKEYIKTQWGKGYVYTD